MAGAESGLLAGMSLPTLFSSRIAFRDAFIAGLERQLAEPGLGTFILVLANASFDADIWPQLRDRLEQRFDELSDEVAAALRSGRKLSYPEDDLVVFLKLMAMGFAAIMPTEFRRAGPWQLQYNPLRALRPARVSGQKVETVTPPPFNPAGFQFNKPFLRPEILWEGQLRGHPVRLLYNKFPFAPLHGLLAPDPEAGLPQRLNQEWHHAVWHLTGDLAAGLPGLGIAYNSYGAQASVNHLHFQTFLGAADLPALDPRWKHNGGGEAYPTRCHVFESALDAWFFLESLHRADLAYNLIYVPGRLYCLPRRFLGTQAWYEMAGGATAFNRDEFGNLTEAELSEELSRLAPVIT
jgi:hypothetical protein